MSKVINLVLLALTVFAFSYAYLNASVYEEAIQYLHKEAEMCSERRSYES